MIRILALVAVMFLAFVLPVQAKFTHTILKTERFKNFENRGSVVRVLVNGTGTKQELESLVRAVYAKEKRHATKPTGVAVYVYQSKAHLAGNTWVCMLTQGGVFPKPKIEFNDTVFNQIGAKPETRGGLSETKRKAIWMDLMRCEARALRETDYSGSSVAEPLWKKYKKGVLKKYRITPAQAENIEDEGMAKSWPQPE